MRFLISPYKKQIVGPVIIWTLLQLVIGGINLSSEGENSRILTVYYTYLNNGKNRWPLIRLQGKWLQDLGFHSGSKITIEEHGGALLIKAVDDDKMNGDKKDKA